MIRNSCSKGLGRSVDRPACLTRRSFGASNLAAGKGSADLNCIPRERRGQFKVQPSIFMANPGARRLFVLGKLRKARSKAKPKPRSKAKARSEPKSKRCLRYCACDSGARLLSAAGAIATGCDAMVICGSRDWMGLSRRLPGLRSERCNLWSLFAIETPSSVPNAECVLIRAFELREECSDLGFVEMASAGTSRWLVSSVFIVKKWQETGAIVRKVSSAHETRCLVRGCVRNGFRAKRDLHEADRARSGMSRKGIACEGSGAFGLPL